MSIAVLTTTFYQSFVELRFNLACQMIGSAIGMGLRAVVVDGSPDLEVARRLEKIGAEVHRESNKGIGSSRRQLFGIAEDTGDENYFLWTEPEKPDLIRSIPTLVEPLVRRATDIAHMY